MFPVILLSSLVSSLLNQTCSTAPERGNRTPDPSGPSGTGKWLVDIVINKSTFDIHGKSIPPMKKVSSPEMEWMRGKGMERVCLTLFNFYGNCCMMDEWITEWRFALDWFVSIGDTTNYNFLHFPWRQKREWREIDDHPRLASLKAGFCPINASVSGLIFRWLVGAICHPIWIRSLISDLFLRCHLWIEVNMSKV